MNRSALGMTIAFLLFAALGALIIAIDLGLLPPNSAEKKNGLSSQNNSASEPANQVLSPPVLNGKIDNGEYAHVFHDDVTQMDLYWSLIGDTLYMAIHSPGMGWAAVGIAPDGPMMKGGDILMGYVLDGNTILEDQYGDTQVTHKLDTDLGGNTSIISFAGGEDENGTSLEFERDETDLDAYDKPVSRSGSTFVMLAWADKDDTVSYHGGHRNVVSIDFVNH